MDIVITSGGAGTPEGVIASHGSHCRWQVTSKSSCLERRRAVTEGKDGGCVRSRNGGTRTSTDDLGWGERGGKRWRLQFESRRSEVVEVR